MWNERVHIYGTLRVLNNYLKKKLVGRCRERERERENKELIWFGHKKVNIHSVKENSNLSWLIEWSLVFNFLYLLWLPLYMGKLLNTLGVS